MEKRLTCSHNIVAKYFPAIFNVMSVNRGLSGSEIGLLLTVCFDPMRIFINLNFVPNYENDEGKLDYIFNRQIPTTGSY